MTTPLPSGYCVSSRILDLDITPLNFSNTVPSEHNDTYNFIHFAKVQPVEPIACVFLIHGLHGSEHDFDNLVQLLKKENLNDTKNEKYNNKQDEKLLNIPPTIILRSTVNRGFWPTMQGVEECALNALAEIRQCLKVSKIFTKLDL